MDSLSQAMDVMAPNLPVLTGRKTLSSAEKTAMEKASKEFESVFMAQMLKPMWEGVGTDPMFGGGHGEDVMRDLLIQEYGKSMASADNFGLSDAVLGQMIQLQAVTQDGIVSGGQNL